MERAQRRALESWVGFTRLLSGLERPPWGSGQPAGVSERAGEATETVSEIPFRSQRARRPVAGQVERGSGDKWCGEGALEQLLWWRV